MKKLRRKRRTEREKRPKTRQRTWSWNHWKQLWASRGFGLAAPAAECSWLMPPAGASLQFHAWWPEDRKQGGTVSALVSTRAGGTGLSMCLSSDTLTRRVRPSFSWVWFYSFPMNVTAQLSLGDELLDGLWESARTCLYIHTHTYIYTSIYSCLHTCTCLYTYV